jgi:hypothetical protein
VHRYSFPFATIALALTLFSAGALIGCRKKEALLIERVKSIPLSGAKDTLFIERSPYWDTKNHQARVDSNRQVFLFFPPKGQLLFVSVENMGGVPLKRDTIWVTKTIPVEEFLHTSTKDTNLNLHIAFKDWHKAPSDIVLYIRNADSVYAKVRFEGAK